MRFKILVFFLSCLFLAGVFTAAYWYYQNIDQPERQEEAHLKEKDRQARSGNLPDPGQALFAKAVELLRDRQLEPAREQLGKLIRVYKDSARCADARHMLGEMNMDDLFSRSPMPGKHDYTVRPGDSLARIEKGSLTTIAYLNRLNNLSSAMLQPGERLVYQPLEFEIDVSLSARTLTVTQKSPGGKTFDFFKEYAVTTVNLPPGTPKILQTKIHEKTAFLGDKKILPSDTMYQFARKWLQTTGKAGKIGLLFRPQSEHSPEGADKKPAGDDLTYGIFLDDGDIEELATIIRPGTPVTVRR